MEVVERCQSTTKKMGERRIVRREGRDIDGRIEDMMRRLLVLDGF